MAENDTKGLTVKKYDNMPEWYSQVCVKSGLADYSPIKGCMVIRPNGYALWQSIMDYFNKVLDQNSVRNTYFPLFIPESFFKKEAEHAEGFSPEVAWLERKDDQEERLAVRPTSETIMYDSFGKWIRSWRDLPLKINQWCNIVRWEVQDVKLFLRSREFLWQEGHCAYETREEAEKETLKYLNEYVRLAEDLLALPVVYGKKSEKEKFAGAVATYGFESFMPDGKSLQTGTSHFLGDNFAKAFDIKFQGRDEKHKYVFQNSWGISTRLIGAVVMVHGDDKGLVIPPRLAQNKAVVVPIIFKGKDEVIGEARRLADEIKELNPILDDRDEYSAGWKFAKYELEGIPLRVELGPRDIENGTAVLVTRHNGKKTIVKRTELLQEAKKLLENMHHEMFSEARKRMLSLVREPKDYDEFKKNIEDRLVNYCFHCGSTECELAIKEDIAASTRVRPFDQPKEKGKCIRCGNAGAYKVYFARAY